jgi:hypothetical protein
MANKKKGPRVARKGGGSSPGKGPDDGGRSPSSTSQPARQPRETEADNDEDRNRVDRGDDVPDIETDKDLDRGSRDRDDR